MSSDDKGSCNNFTCGHIPPADVIAQLSINKFNQLGKNGKPQSNEWTHLACIIQQTGDATKVKECELKVVSLATGTKCIGFKHYCPDIVSDSHSEVLARRGLLRYFYSELEAAKLGKSDLFHHQDDKGKWHISKEIKFHLYCSHVPCGDASIIPMLLEKNDGQQSFSYASLQSDSKEHDSNHGFVPSTTRIIDNVEGGCNVEFPSNNKCDVLENEGRKESEKLNDFDFRNDLVRSSLKRTRNSFFVTCHEEESCVGKRNKLSTENSPETNRGTNISNISINADFSIQSCEINSIGPAVTDVYRTGAKCLSTSSVQDAKESGVGYHSIGPVRTKPGRGDPTLSVSCSDKIARWIFCGMQGSLLSLIMEPKIIPCSITIGADGPYDQSRMESALLDRSGISSTCYSVPILQRSAIEFSHSGYKYSAGKCKPCPTSIIWFSSHLPRSLEVSVNGKRLGATKKNPESSRLLISKRELFKEFKKHFSTTDVDSYLSCKKTASFYIRESEEFKLKMGGWTSKEESDFCD